jgi:hypothetical protein
MVARYFGSGLLVVGAGCAGWSINPRLNTTQPSGYIFWQSILGHGTRNDFVAAVAEMTPEEAQTHVAQHLYDLSGICVKKYWWINLAIILASAGTIWSGVTYLLRSTA